MTTVGILGDEPISRAEPSMSASPDGSRFAVSTLDGTVYLLDLRNVVNELMRPSRLAAAGDNVIAFSGELAALREIVTWADQNSDHRGRGKMRAPLAN